MNIRKKIVIGFLILLATSMNANDGKTTKVMEELIQFHDLLIKESPGKINVYKLKSLLKKGGDSKEDSVVFKKAIPIVDKLGKATTFQAKQDSYSELVEALSGTVGHHDKSGANVFFCPMVNKKWIDKGDKIENPYKSDMRNCGEKL